MPNTQTRPEILVVEDDKRARVLLAKFLTKNGYSTTESSNVKDSIGYLNNSEFDAVLLDLILPDGSGTEILKKISQEIPALPVIILTGYGSIRDAVSATKLGAFDYIEKPPDPDSLLTSIRNAIEVKKLKVKQNRLLHGIRERTKILGNSPPITELRIVIAKVAASNTRVLIHGETGTGKELVVEALHSLSDRVEHPLIKLNCATIPNDLLESTMFGHSKGAFTGAFADKAGQFEEAHRGTLFLDEIGELSLDHQVKLLRVIEEGQVYRIGENSPHKVNVRILSATSRNIPELIEQNLFREELNYRLSEIKIEVPPLRDRREDIPLLADFFLKKFCEDENIRLKTFSPEATSILISADWKGNIRQLQNVTKRLVVLVENSLISEKDILDHIRFDAVNLNEISKSDLKKSKESFEEELIRNKLISFDGSVALAAESLGIERTNLYKKIKKYGIGIS